MYKKQAVLLGKHSSRAINKVFNGEIRERIRQHVNLYDIVVDNDPEQLHRHAEDLNHAQYAFSTWGMPQFSEEDIRTFLPNLRVLFYAAGSVQSFARPFLHCGVQVCSAAAANGVPVAEYTLAQILLANKGFFQTSLRTKQDYRDARSYFESFPGNYNAKVGLLGAGVIGSRVAELLKPFDLEVWVYDPFLSDERAAQLNVRKTGLIEIFASCQTISNHLPNKPDIVGLLNKAHFSHMGEYATFINTGRGMQVVEEDLAAALREVPTRTAVLDVTIQEPLQPNSPLLELDNVVLTPHIAGSSGREVIRMAEYMLDELERIERGVPVKYGVSLQMLETMS